MNVVKETIYPKESIIQKTVSSSDVMPTVSEQSISDIQLNKCFCGKQNLNDVFQLVLAGDKKYEYHTKNTCTQKTFNDFGYKDLQEIFI